MPRVKRGTGSKKRRNRIFEAAKGYYGSRHRLLKTAREHGISYSRLIHGLEVAGVEVDRKILAELAVKDPKAFGDLAALAKSQAA